MLYEETVYQIISRISRKIPYFKICPVINVQRIIRTYIKVLTRMMIPFCLEISGDRNNLMYAAQYNMQMMDVS